MIMCSTDAHHIAFWQWKIQLGIAAGSVTLVKRGLPVQQAVWLGDHFLVQADS